MALTLTLRVWRQPTTAAKGRFETYRMEDINEEASFLEMLDILNEQLTNAGQDPVAFDHDCREGICGSCGVVINGIPHGGQKGTATCQLHMRHFRSGQTITIEPWRAAAFPIIKDLVVDRSTLDEIVSAGGFITSPTGSAPEANETRVPKSAADTAMDAAECIQCGACVAACPNAAAQLFTAAKVSHLNLLPQGQPERWTRVLKMVDRMEDFFGTCTLYGECEAVCPKEISIDFIALMNRDYLKAKFKDNRLDAQ